MKLIIIYYWGLIGYLSYELYRDQESNPILISIKTTTKNIEELDFPTGKTINSRPFLWLSPI